MSSNIATRKDPATERSNTLARYLEGRETELVKALRGFVDPKHFIRVGVTLYRQGGKGTLIECTPDSVMAALFEGAQLGLSPDPHLKEFWLVPRSAKVGNEWVKRATFQIGVHGLVKLARRSGEVLSIQPRLAYEGDRFDVILGTDDERIEHVPNPKAKRNDDTLDAAYAVARVRGKDGTITKQFDWMYRDDIEEAADRSGKDGKRGDSWRNHFRSMAEVRIVGRLCKWLPKTDELAIALHRNSEREAGIEPDAVIQVEAETVRTRRGINQLAASTADVEPESTRAEEEVADREPPPEYDHENGEVAPDELPDDFA